MREAGLSDSEIRAREAEVRANAHEQTLRSLKEFFLLAKIAEAEGIKVEEEDFDQEIEAIAARTDETPRRIRARIEKEGLAEGLARRSSNARPSTASSNSSSSRRSPMVEEKDVETLDQAASPAPEEPAEAGAGESAESESPAESEQG